MPQTILGRLQWVLWVQDDFDMLVGLESLPSLWTPEGLGQPPSYSTALLSNSEGLSPLAADPAIIFPHLDFIESLPIPTFRPEEAHLPLWGSQPSGQTWMHAPSHSQSSVTMGTDAALLHGISASMARFPSDAAYRLLLYAVLSTFYPMTSFPSHWGSLCYYDSSSHRCWSLWAYM